LSRLATEEQRNDHLEHMANPVSQIRLTEERLEAPEEIVDRAAGGIVDFWGVVRELEDGREIEGIEYEAHKAMAGHQLEKIAQEAISKFAVKRLYLCHRVGFVPAGQASLFLRVACGHRGEAFKTSQWIVDELKQRVPIWKRPRFKIDNRKAKNTGLTAKTASIPQRT
jgi:molybdopterin synthase catalytic subunit